VNDVHKTSRVARLLPALLVASCASTPGITDLGMEASAVRSNGTRPLVVEWPSSDRAELEALARRGVVAVRYDRTGIRLLPQCGLAGHYAYSPLTPKKDQIMIRTVDELRAQVPLGAAKLEGVLERSGGLAVDMTVVGRFEANPATGWQGDCSEATHYVGALTVGAFDFLAGASSGGELGAGGPAGIRGGRSEARQILNRDGDEAACRTATATDKAPPYGCGAVMRVDLVAVDVGPGPAPALMAAPHAGPTQGVAPPTPFFAQGRTSRAGMVRIPGGTARLGAADLADHALPVHDVRLGAFDIDVTEVTIRAYGECVESGPCTPPGTGPVIPGQGTNNGCGRASESFQYANKPPGNEEPVHCVTAGQAAQYCAFRGKRLPTEEEWEYAARGTDFRRFPWGNADPTDTRLPPCHSRPSRACLVGTAPGDRSPFGVLDMAGSMREIAVSPSGNVVRGGLTGTNAVYTRTAYREAIDSTGGDTRSFRCAASL
jgi:hypothetical protein